ncbi:MAG: hypothetical protein GX410_07900 [Elusimicrobia bacterium]|nr:hypothetical protein [Elusimicrobiota bacterium]
MTGANDGASYEVDSAKMRLPYVPPFFSRLKIYRLAYYALHGDMFGAPQKPANDLGQPSCAEKGPGSGDWAALCEKYSSEAPNQKAFLAAIDGLEKSASPDPIGYRVCGLAAAFSYGMADRGQKLLDKALALKPDGLENNVGALKFYLLARADSATAAVHEAAALRALSPLTDPKRKASAFVGLAAAFNSAGQIAKARSYYLKAAAEYRGSSSAYSGLCMTYTPSAGDRKEFLKMLPDLERSFPDGPAGLRVCGQSAANNWRLLGVAERLMSAAIRAFPADSESRFAAADFYRKWRHDQPKAEGMLSSVLSAEPGSVHAAAELELSKGGNKAVPRERRVAYSPSAIANYRRMADLLSSRGIVFLAMQYPMRSAVPLKEALEGRSGAVIVGNENFAQYVSEKGYAAYFRDMYAGDFGHCTDAGNRLIAENVARILAEQVLPPSGRRN